MELAADEIDEVETPEKCQELCNKNDRCNWFSWSDLRLPKGCWLLAKNGDTKNADYSRDQGANGPKNCGGE